MNTQPDLFSARPMTVQQIAQAHGNQLSTEFLNWLPDNMHIWDAFVRESMSILRRGYTHYSSRTIIEYLRHNTALSQNDGEFKINNNIQPYLPRLFNLIYPQHRGLWEFRATTKRKG